jgi:hypothetical protein
VPPENGTSSVIRNKQPTSHGNPPGTSQPGDVTQPTTPTTVPQNALAVQQTYVCPGSSRPPALGTGRFTLGPSVWLHVQDSTVQYVWFYVGAGVTGGSRVRWCTVSAAVWWRMAGCVRGGCGGVGAMVSCSEAHSTLHSSSALGGSRLLRKQG